MGQRMEGRRAFITGGANGLGAATAELFASEGACVTVADLPSMADRAAGLVERIERGGGRAWFEPLDVRDAAMTEQAVGSAAEAMGGVDTVVASAGVGVPPGQPDSFRGLIDLAPESFDSLQQVNVRGVLLTFQSAARRMIDDGRPGAMVSLASMASKRPTSGAYAVSKAAVWMLTRCMAHELAAHGIRVNAIGPGYVDTELFDGIVRGAAPDDPAGQQRFRADRLRQVPLGRFGTPRDVAETALFLCSDAGAYFTGSILHPDGGYTSLYGGG